MRHQFSAATIFSPSFCSLSITQLLQNLMIFMQSAPFPRFFLALTFAMALARSAPPAHAQGAAPAFWSWAATPPMGWNSYDTFGGSVTEAETMANAACMQKYLLPHGWRYVVIDFRWYDPQPVNDDRMLNTTRAGAQLAADQYGRLMPAPDRFPSAADGAGFKPIAAKLHAMGLKFGIHVMRGVPRQAATARSPIQGSALTAAAAANAADTCPWCPDMFGAQANAAGQAWYDAEFRLYAAWGVDFVKVDDLSQPYHPAEIAMIRKAIDNCGRPIVLSASPGPTPVSMAGGIATNANMWRISGDFWDHWSSLNKQFDLLASWRGVGGPGHWPDADMIPFGHIGIRSWINGWDRWTRFSRDEQKTLMTLWALAPSPMMLGMNLPDNDASTLALLTNDEVLAINQDPLGRAGRRVLQDARTEVWIKDLKDGSLAIGLFNRGPNPASVTLPFRVAGLTGRLALRDLWARRALGPYAGSVTLPLPPHGAALLRATAAKLL